MGLRIIGRTSSGGPREITETERLSALETVADDWVKARTAAGDAPEAGDRDAILARYRRLRPTLGSPEVIMDKANGIRQSILGRSQVSALPHERVDVATLLELL